MAALASEGERTRAAAEVVAAAANPALRKSARLCSAERAVAERAAGAAGAKAAAVWTWAARRRAAAIFMAGEWGVATGCEFEPAEERGRGKGGKRRRESVVCRRRQ